MKIKCFFIIILLSLSVGVFVGVVWEREFNAPPPTTQDTLVVHDTTVIKEPGKPGKIIILGSDNEDSLVQVLSVYEHIVDSLFDKLDVIAEFDSSGEHFDLMVKYKIPKNSFDVGLSIYHETTVVTEHIEHIPKWWEDISLYMDSDVYLGVGYSALSLAYNPNTNGVKVTFNPRLGDLKRWLRKK